MNFQDSLQIEDIQRVLNNKDREVKETKEDRKARMSSALKPLLKALLVVGAGYYGLKFLKYMIMAEMVLWF